MKAKRVFTVYSDRERLIVNALFPLFIGSAIGLSAGLLLYFFAAARHLAS